MIQESENDYILFIADIDFEYQVRWLEKNWK